MSYRLLDLFCGAGGAAVGYARAGFTVVGVDSHPMPNFPYEFHQDDAFEFLAAHGHEFDVVHASPPCQSYSDLAKRNKNGHLWPRLIEPIREALQANGRPYVIENVEGAPLLAPIVLCGTMFPTLRVLRHRLFESSFQLKLSPLRHRLPHPLVFTHDKRKAHYGKLNQDESFVQVTGGGNCTVRNAKLAMGIGWMTKNEMNEAIPPAYSQFLGRQMYQQLTEGWGL